MLGEPLRTSEEPPASEAALDSLQRWVRSGIGAVVRAGRRGVVYVLAGTITGTAISLLLPNRYDSSATFIAQKSSSSLVPAGLQGLAASFGIGEDNDYSPKFYADLVASRPILLAAITKGYRVPSGDSTRVADYVSIEHLNDVTPALATEAALKDLAKRVTARADARTNIVTVSVQARYPTLARDILTRLLQSLDSLNINFRQEQSRGLRMFYETRVRDAQRQLDSTETELQHFLERNRTIQNSPLLTFEQDRLQRTLDIKRAVYTTIIQQYEQARLEEARNVPTLTVLAEPYVPIKKSGPPRRLIVSLGALVGLGILWLQGRATVYLLQLKAEEPEAWQLLQKTSARVRRRKRER